MSELSCRQEGRWVKRQGCPTIQVQMLNMVQLDKGRICHNLVAVVLLCYVRQAQEQGWDIGQTAEGAGPIDP